MWIAAQCQEAETAQGSHVFKALCNSHVTAGQAPEQRAQSRTVVMHLLTIDSNPFRILCIAESVQTSFFCHLSLWSLSFQLANMMNRIHCSQVPIPHICMGAMRLWSGFMFEKTCIGNACPLVSSVYVSGTRTAQRPQNLMGWRIPDMISRIEVILSGSWVTVVNIFVLKFVGRHSRDFLCAWFFVLSFLKFLFHLALLATSGLAILN